MNPIHNFINKVEHGSIENLSTQTIKSVVLHLEEQPHIDWDDEKFYQLPRVLKHMSKSLELMSEDVIFALEPLFALLPDGLRQTKGLLQNSFYTSFVMDVLKARPEIGARFLHQGMTAGRHLYTKGENLSFVVQREIFLDVARIFIENATANQFSEFLDVVENHHEPHMYENAYQNMLHTLVISIHDFRQIFLSCLTDAELADQTRKTHLIVFPQTDANTLARQYFHDVVAKTIRSTGSLRCGECFRHR